MQVNRELVKVNMTNDEYKAMKICRRAFRGQDPKPARDLNKLRKICLSNKNNNREYLVDKEWFDRYTIFARGNIANDQKEIEAKRIADSKAKSKETLKAIFKRSGL